jgi:hypothetical protein
VSRFSGIHGLALLAAAGVFVFSWLLRFNDPNGSFAGLTDDHFFYLIRGWQILYGDLPVRDFVDHGAPLYFYVAAAVQALFGRGTLSELAFSVTMVSLGAALTFWLAARTSGSILLGLFGAAVQLWMAPRFYNYPKILVYACAVPLLWRFVERAEQKTVLWIAVVTAIGFLLRHDHGVYVALAFGAAVVVTPAISVRERLRHGAMYALFTCALLAPYLVFIQMNGGVGSYLRQASAWAARDRDRAPVIWPGLFDFPDGRSAQAETGNLLIRPFAVVRDNAVAWWYYAEIALPILALAVMAVSRHACRPGWDRAGPKIAVVAVLALILDAGFLRSPLAARLADPSVPLVVLLAWLCAALPRMLRTLDDWKPRLRAWRTPITAPLVAAAVPIGFVLAATMLVDIPERLDASAFGGRVTRPFEQAVHVANTLRADWDLQTWQVRESRPDLVTLALYLHACTPPDARIFVQPYIPQVLALARRGFAGGHADLRPGFFTTQEAQELTLARLMRQNVPVALLETGESYENFRESFPLVVRYLDAHYSVAGAHVFDDRYGVTLLVRRGVATKSEYPGLGWACPQ